MDPCLPGGASWEYQLNFLTGLPVLPGNVGAFRLSAQALASRTVLIRLPDGSGVEACREIKKAHPDMRVVMLTSYSDEEAIVGSVMAGANGYLLKQADSDQLTRAIREAAARGSSDDAPSAASRIARVSWSESACFRR